MFYMHKVSIDKKKNAHSGFCSCCSQGGHKMALYFCQMSEYFLRKTCAKCSFSEKMLYKLKLDQIRIYDVHPQLIGAVTGHLQAYFCFKKC